ncbi:hypothetical protein V8C86DRAFT_2750946 [Haematococcus lacustris]
MRQLHLHVISQDLQGAALKTREHYQSFATSFFVSLDQVEHELRTEGCVRVDPEAASAALKAELRCHRCGVGHHERLTFPQMQQHLRVCTADYSGSDVVLLPGSEPDIRQFCHAI